MIQIDNKWIYYIMFWMIFAIIFILSAVVVSESVFGEVIEPGQCYYRNISVGMNETLNETIDVCSNNCTFKNESVVFNVTLHPGQDRYMKDKNCEADFTCELGESTSAKCIYTKKLDPGDEVNILTENCDLDIEVDECGIEYCGDTIVTEFKEEYEISYNGFNDEIEIEFAGKKYRYSLGNESSFDIRNTVTYTCPVKLGDEKIDTGDILEQCKAVVPVYCTELSGILMRRFDSCEGRKNAVQDELDQCQATITHSVCVESKAYAELIASGKITQNESVKCIFNEGKLTRDLENKTDTTNELWFFVIVLAGINFYQYFSKPKSKFKTAMG